MVRLKNFFFIKLKFKYLGWPGTEGYSYAQYVPTTASATSLLPSHQGRF